MPLEADTYSDLSDWSEFLSKLWLFLNSFIAASKGGALYLVFPVIVIVLSAMFIL
jgi:hypothetical protein